MIKTTVLILLFVITTCFTSVYSQKKNFTISGYIKEKKSKELLIGVNIYIPGTQTGTTSNSYGFYSITLPPQNLELTYSYVGFKQQTLKFVFSKDTMINIELENAVELQGVEIVAENDDKISNQIEMSVVSVPIKQIREIPAFLGEKDVFKVLQLMPGVRSGSEGSSGLYVRGGGPDQNLIILDDATVYNANHLFGFFSIFNGDAIKSVELTKGGFPARYGGRLSSVVDINMKDGNKTKFGGEAGIGLIASRLVLEGPIVKNKSSFLVSARRTYLDILAQPFILANNDGQPMGYYFYDLNAKLNYDFGDKNKLFLSGYFGRDKAYMNFYEGTDNLSKNGLFWQNSTATARWNHVFNSKTFSNTSLIYSKYLFKIYSRQEDAGNTFELNYYSGIEDVSVKYDMAYIPLPNHYIRFGGLLTSHIFTPSAVVLKDQQNNEYEANIKKLYSLESAIYAEDEFKIKANTKVNAGFRVSHFNHKTKNYVNFEPRILASYMIKEDLSIKASYTIMNQFIHLLSNTGISLPIDLWVPATQNIRPQKSQQIALGMAKDFSKPRFSLSAEIYYKTMNHIIAYKEGASFLMIGDFDQSTEFNYESSVTSGDGYSTGLEILAQKKYGNWTGWIGYTLSFTKYQFDELNNGKAFYPRHDRRHDISVVAIYEIKKNITLSATWVYGTGDAVTLAQSTFLTNPHGENFLENLKNSSFWYNYASNYGDKNSFRYAPYHRLDLGIQMKKEFKRYTRVWEFSIYNAYNRHNPYMYYVGYGYNFNQQYPKLMQMSLFPFIPSVSYNIKF